jgi:hypothetical protein
LSNNANVVRHALQFQLEVVVMKSNVILFALLSLTAIVANAPAQAQTGMLTRSFVSSSGNDTNACTIAAPCASFAQAYTKVGADGIVAALDPGKYGPINITSPVTINGNGWAAITAPAGGNGITINASSGSVILTGLEIDGAGAAYNGIALGSASSLTVSNCTVQNFIQNPTTLSPLTGNGIIMAPTSSALTLAITNTTLSNNAASGVSYFPQTGIGTVTNGLIDHVIAQANGIGISVAAGFGGATVINVSNSIASNNRSMGILVDNGGGPSLKVSIDNVNANGNNLGVSVANTAIVLLNRSVVTGNATGVQSNGALYSFGNNVIFQNVSNGNGVAEESLF